MALETVIKFAIITKEDSKSLFFNDKLIEVIGKYFCWNNKEKRKAEMMVDEG